MWDTLRRNASRVEERRGGLGQTASSYRVNATTIVDAHAAGLRTDVSEPALALVTCYPFDTPVPGGPLRYVVTAGPLPPAPAPDA